MCCQFGLEVGDLTVQLADDPDRGTGGRGERGGDRGGGGELLGAQRGWISWARVEVALSSAAFEGGTDLGQAQMRGSSGVGARPSTARASRSCRSSNASSAAG